MLQTQLSALAKELISRSPHSPSEDLRGVVPNQLGAYVWSEKSSGQIVYAGSATGNKGLYRRIIGQHLNPKYLLTNKEKWHQQKDAFQIVNFVLSNGKPAIDKSAFRKNIGRAHRIRPGEGTVRFIKDNFILRFIVLPSRETALSIEDEIIDLYCPRYNISGNPGAM